MPVRPAARRIVALAAAVLFLGALVGCGSTTPTGPASDPLASPDATQPTGSGSPGPSPVPTDPAATPHASAPSQTDTAWGRIWDGLPAAFPRFPGASPTETGEGPASVILDVGDTPPAEVASFYEASLEGAGFLTVAVEGPREDASWGIESIGDATCRIQTTVTPLGGTTIVTILYGADCPFG